MSPLRRRMLEDMKIRNLSDNTQLSYLQQVSSFANYFKRSPEDLGPAEIQIGDNLFIGPRTASERDGGMMHLNHSCEPNVGIRGEITFVAMRDIRSDEELSFDYAMTDDEPDIDMQCNCGAPDCRRVITGSDWKRPDLQRRYEGYFSAYLQCKIATSADK